MQNDREQMSIVIVGHVDHGKSTVIGRLLADTGSLPQGKLEQVKRQCALNAKPFEYAFLLDALKDEQSQGITIDTARCFFKTAKRYYIIIDAPGHIEFLKNMITGAARAEAALLVIDAKEGVQENSRRHGYMLSMLGIRQVVVLVNKMDLAQYQKSVFESVKEEYHQFLRQINVEPLAFIPISAREGDNLTVASSRMPWYQGPNLLQRIDDLSKEQPKTAQPFRMPVQDIYKFTEAGDDRRIVAGTVETGIIHSGDEVIFLPSFKKSTIRSIEGFNQAPGAEIGAGYATGVTLETQIYIRPGEVMCRPGEPLPEVGTCFRASLFWLGRQPMIPGKKYKLKLTTQRTTMTVTQIHSVLDASELAADTGKNRIDRHDVAECTLQTAKPIAFDLSQEIAATGRFVIIDQYEIVGGGIITASLLEAAGTDSLEDLPEMMWAKSRLSASKRGDRVGQKPVTLVLTGLSGNVLLQVAQELEEWLFQKGHSGYCLGLTNLWSAADTDPVGGRESYIRRLGEMSRMLTDAGQIAIIPIPELDSEAIEVINRLNQPDGVSIIRLDEPGEKLWKFRFENMTEKSLGLRLEYLEDKLYEQGILLKSFGKFFKAP